MFTVLKNVLDKKFYVLMRSIIYVMYHFLYDEKLL